MTFPPILHTFFCNNDVEPYVSSGAFFLYGLFCCKITKNEHFRYVKTITSVFNKAMQGYMIASLEQNIRSLIF